MNAKSETLRKLRNSSSITKINKGMDAIKNPNSNKSYTDDRFWKLQPDKAGNATATIRFLPATLKTIDGVDQYDELPWVRTYAHGFQGPTGKWYIEDCLSTIGEDCPACKSNTLLWNSGNEEDKELAKGRKRRLSYIANILVIADPNHPENNGKVFLYKFGKKIFDKIMDKAQPTFQDDEPVNVFDLWEGANFKLRQIKKDGYPNFDQSAFTNQSAISEDEDELLKIVGQQHLLSEFVNKDRFKTYADLDKRLKSVLDDGAVSTRSAAEIAEDDDYTPPTRIAEPKKAEAPKIRIQPKPQVTTEDEDDDAMGLFFQNIANDE